MARRAVANTQNWTSLSPSNRLVGMQSVNTAVIDLMCRMQAPGAFAIQGQKAEAVFSG